MNTGNEPKTGDIDRDGVCDYINSLLCDLGRNKRRKTDVVLRMVAIFPCMTQESANDLLDAGKVLNVVNNQLEWV